MFGPYHPELSPIPEYKVSSAYICKRCRISGHHILNCPTNLDSSYDVRPESDYECSICHKLGVHYGTLCPYNKVNTSITQQRLAHSAFMERTERREYFVDNQHEDTEGRLNVSDNFENMVIQDTEMGGVDRVRAARIRDRSVRANETRRGQRGAGLVDGTHLDIIHPASIRLVGLEDRITMPDEEDKSMGPLKSGANIEPIAKKAVSGKKRKVDDCDHVDERNKKGVKLSHVDPQQSNHLSGTTDCPSSPIQDISSPNSPIHSYSPYIMSLFRLHPSMSFERKRRITALDMWDQDETDYAMREDSAEGDYYSCASSAPTSPFADADSSTYIDEGNESQDYEADNEKEQYQDISMDEPQNWDVEGPETLDW